MLEIGDPLDLEVIADLLSTDAVQITPGAAVKIDGWGGSPLSEASVTRVDPAGFVKVSALGIEEQRVRTTIDFAGATVSLGRDWGHDYRVIVHVTVWKARPSKLTVPVGSLFRRGSDWAVFSVKGRARTRNSRPHRPSQPPQLAEVLSGLSAGDRVVLHPSDRVKEGIRVSERES